MNTKARVLFVAVAAGLLLGGVSAWAQYDLYYQSASQAHIAPNPIAVKALSGATTVGMNQCRWTSSTAAGPQDISSMTLKLEGTVDWADIGLVRVYYSTTTFNPASLGTRIDDNNGGAGYYFTSQTLIVNLSMSTTSITTGPNNFVTVVFDFDPGTDTTETVAVEITALVNGDDGVGTGGTHAPLGEIDAESPIDDYETTIAGTDISPASAEQTEQNVPVLKLVLDPVETSVTLDSIKVHSVGTPGQDDDVANVKLFRDDGNGSFEAAADTLLVMADLAGGYATLNPTVQEPLPDTGSTYFVAVDVASQVFAGIGNTIGLEVQNPSTDVVFVDTVLDSYTNQMGYIVQATPTANGTFTIDLLIVPDTTPPEVSTGIPVGSTVLPTSQIIIIFSENMDETQLPPALLTNIEIKEELSGTPVAISNYTYNDVSNTLTMTPTELDNSVTYRVTVKGSASGGTTRDQALNLLVFDYTWVFTVAPGFPEPIAVNNRIQPGVNDHTEIHIPTPPADAGGVDALVTVQVFTPTGKKVATLKNAVKYSDLSADLPLLWYGKNGRDEDLGPGLYIVKVSAPGWSRTLKVMIVR